MDQQEINTTNNETNQTQTPIQAAETASITSNQTSNEITTNPNVSNEQNIPTQKSSSTIKNVLTTCYVLLFLLSLFFTAIYIFVPIVISSISSVSGSFMSYMPFLFKIDPIYFYLIIPMSILITLVFFSAINIRSLSKNAWRFGLLSIMSTILIGTIGKFGLTYFIDNLTKAGITNTITNAAANSITPGILLILATILIMTFTRKHFTNENLKFKSAAVNIAVVFGVVAFVASTAFVTFIANKSVEKPFIGYSDCKKNIGNNPVFFEHIPDGFDITNSSYNKEGNKGCQIFLSDPQNIFNSNSHINIIETVQKPSFKNLKQEKTNNKAIGYFIIEREGSMSNQVLLFEKNDLWISMIIDNNTFTKKWDELSKLIESAY